MTIKTLFIVGAGASSEANLPTGEKLKQNIAKLLDYKYERYARQLGGDNDIYDALVAQSRKDDFVHPNLDSYIKAAWHIRDAMPQAISIDNFLDSQSGDTKIELCGKLAIVRSILSAEKGSLLYIDKNDTRNKLKFSDIQKKWYTSLWQLLTENCQKTDLAERFKSFALIVFNYDRCIEHFLFHSLQNYYKITGPEAAEIISNLEIHHPYGTAGDLPWQNSQTKVAFGEDVYSEQLLELASQIKTFTEGTDPDSSEIIAIRNCVLNSHKVVFLGFAYHRLNLNLLAPSGFTSSGPVGAAKCYGTSIGISVSDTNLIKKDISKLFNNNITDIYLTEIYCADLFQEYKRSLALL